MSNKIIVIVGATASGKSKISLELAKKINANIINADSRQIYKEICIGTAKPTNQTQETVFWDEIKHFGFNLCGVYDNFNVANFLDYFNEKAEETFEENKNLILCGGTGLYLDACIFGLSKIPEISVETKQKVRKLYEEVGLEELAKVLRQNDKITNLDEKNPHRVIRALEVFLETKIPLAKWHELNPRTKTNFEFEIFGLELERKKLYEKINKRVDFMLENGMLEEAKFLKKFNFKDEGITKFGIGYRYLIYFLDGKMDFDEAKELMKKETRNYAKRQLTWLRKDENIHWINAEQKEKETLDEILAFPTEKIDF